MVSVTLEIVEPDEFLAGRVRAVVAPIAAREQALREGLGPLTIHVCGPGADARVEAADQRFRVAVVRTRAELREAMAAGHELVVQVAPGDEDGGLEELSLRLLHALEERRRAELSSLERRDLTALLQLSRELNDRGDMESTLFLIARQVAQVMRGERCAIVLLDERGEDGFIVAASDDPNLRAHPIPVKTGYPEILEVVRTRAPLFIDDIAQAPLFEPVRAQLRGKPLGHAILFPVLLAERVAGVIHVRGAAPRASILSPHQLQFGWIVANVAAIALRNARLYQTVRERAERVLSARARAERRIRQLETYQRFFDLASDGLVILDPHGRFLFANQEAQRLFGFDPRDLRRLGLLDVVAESSEGAARALLDKLREGSARVRTDLAIVRATGEMATLASSGAAIGEAEEGTHAAIVSFRDVTEPRRTEEALRKTSGLLAQLIEASADAVVAADTEGRVLVFNRAAEQITGHRRDALVGTRVVERLYPPGVAREIMRQLRAPEAGGRFQSPRAELIGADGSRIPIALSVALIHDSGKPTATVGVFSDLRDRLRLAADLETAQKKLELSERQAAVAELAGALAHELNQPLTSILGSAELLARVVGTEERGRVQVDRILREGERLAEMVRRLGRITQYRTKPYVGTTQIVDLSAASEKDP